MTDAARPMQAMQMVARGQSLVARDLEIPRPAKGQVLVKVAACGLNFADLLVIDGVYQEKPALPATLGMELAGTVAAIGEGVSGVSLGQRVAAYTGFGGLAEYATVDADACVTLPDDMPFEHAAAFLVAYGTSHVALDYRAQLQPGERLLVLGATGGVGLTAVELGQLMGAEVIAVARGQAKLALARKVGADHLLDSETCDLRADVKALGGADVVFDPVGGAQFDAALRACNPGARLLPLGFASGHVPKIPANYLLVKNLSVLGLYWGGYTKLDPKVLKDSFDCLFDWYTQGRLAPTISHVLPLRDANAGLDLIRQRKATGKVVITI